MYLDGVHDLLTTYYYPPTYHKALLLTFVVTATSRLPIKGSKASQTSSNTTRRVDLSGLYKDPFFQRAPVAAPHPDAAAAAKDKVHDVPI